MTENSVYRTLNKEWLKEAKLTVKESSYYNFITISENHLLKKFDKIKIKNITEEIIQTYIYELYQNGRLDQTGGLEIRTIRDIILVLRLSLKYANKKKIHININWDNIIYPKDLKNRQVKAISKEEQQKLTQAIYMNLNRKSSGILMALFLGLRIGELCGIQMKDISIENKTISINKTVQRIYNKRLHKTEIKISTPKTISSIREIPIPDLLVNVIKKYYTDDSETYYLTGKKKPTEPRTYRQYFQRFIKKHDLPKFKFHELRHTFAIRAIEIPEFDIKSLSEILGHKNVSFTLNTYGKANQTQKRKCMNLLNDLL